MRAFSSLLAVVVLASGCDDALGPAGGCDAEMRDIRRSYGQPDDTRRDESSGDYSEIWTYDPRGVEPGRYVVFRWGTSIGGCVVDGPVTIDLVPILPESPMNPTRAAAVSKPLTAHRIA